jgi:hypothetical protein
MAKPIFARSILISLAWALVVQSALAQAPTIKTVVGGSGFLLQSTGTTVSFSVGAVSAVAVDPNGNLYIADPTHGSVYSLNAKTGAAIVLVGNGASGDTVALQDPRGLATDGKGNLYIADVGVVYKVATSGGTPKVVAGCGTVNNPACSGLPDINDGGPGDGGPATSAYIPAPVAVAVDGSGNLFIADAGNCRIRKVTATSGIITTVAGSTTGAADSGFNCGTNGDGGPATNAQLFLPTGIAVDSTGNIFISDSIAESVREVCASSAGPCGGVGNIQTVVGGGGGSPNNNGDGGSAATAYLYSPKAVAVDSSGNLYIADTGNNRVRFVNNGSSAITVEDILIQPGNIQTIAGDGIAGYNPPQPGILDEGLAIAVSLNAPVSVAVSGNLVLIADSSNLRVRAVNLTENDVNVYSGVQIYGESIATVAGNGVIDIIPDGAGEGNATSFQLGSPQSVSEDASSNIYVGETPPRIFEAVSASNTVKPIAGNGTSGFAYEGDFGPALAAQLQPPTGLFLDTSDNVIFADALSGLQKVDSTSGVIQPIAQTTEGFYGASGDSSNNLYFSTPLLVIRTPNTVYYGTGLPLEAPYNSGYPYSAAVLGDNGPAANAQFGNITGLCLDVGGKLYITDDVTFLVRVVNTGLTAIDVGGIVVPPGFINTIAGGGGRLPPMRYDHYYYTAEQVGDGGPATSAVIAPTGCFVDNLGNVFVADEYNDRIRRVDHSTGIITTVAGLPTGYPGFSGDGESAASASLNFPNSVWGDQVGNLLISDSGNHRIREISGLLPVPSTSLSCQNCSLTNVPGASSIAVVTLTNSGAAPLIMSTGPSLTDSTGFTISASSCPIGLPGLKPQSSCTVSVAIKGTVSASTNLVFHHNASLSDTSIPTPDPANAGQWSGYLQSEAITSTFTIPSVNFSPLSLVFTAENVAQPITVQNTSPVALNVSSVTVPASFALQTNPPSDSCSNSGAAFSVQPMSSCNIYLVFAPSSSGTSAANPVVTISDNTATSPQTIPLVGYALAPSGTTTFSISNSTPASVNATFNLIGIPSSADVSPVCIVTPAGLDANCTYSASNQSITASVSIPSCVQTSAADLPNHGGGARYLSMGIVSLALLLPWGSSIRKRRLLSVLKIALLCYVGGGFLACTNTNHISSGCVASVAPGTTFNLDVTANPKTPGQFPSLTLTTPDVINVTK